jgi:IS605 OrfB family transposase
LERNEVSLLTCNGRLKLPVKLNDHAKQYINWTYCSASLIFRKNKFFLNIQFKKDMEDVATNGTFVGVDRGIKKLAVTSNNQFFSGGEIRRISQRYGRLRSRLQKSGTRSAKRHLVRLSGREKRFKADVNHIISKKIIESLNRGDTIVLENLTGIRNQRLRKKQRRFINSWNFYQLEQFLKYKGEIAGINIVYVDARYTSLRCSKCGNIQKRNRKTQSKFQCGICGFNLNADLNAARNIRLKYLEAQRASDRALVNEPIVNIDWALTPNQ